ncbi:MAG: hypothetical protein UY63_C0017G0057 [Parcubacteria group bacterium GW2011_GWA2_51_10]|nr:MAG: hypothetical protein UY63_C0017G0057 [Parcubacteria group bacterium GW2011_GWA2_51_10]
MRYLPKSTEELLTWYERYVSPVTLIIGFSLDAFIVRNVDLLGSAFFLFGYLVIAGSGILLLNLILAGALLGRVWNAAAPFLPVVIQFAFGGLFSGFVILYSQSAALAVSWIFVVALALLLISNERFRKLYGRFAFQIGILFFGLFSFLTFSLPVLLTRIQTDTFVVGGVLSIFIIALYVRLIEYFIPALVRENRRTVLSVIGSIFLLVNVLYFTNAIPPFPLALKEAGVYHSIQKKGDTYVLEEEPRRWYEFYLRYHKAFHKAPGERVYVFTAVYLPADFSAQIFHQWEYHDKEAGEWIESGSYSFPITGGRSGGYRVYTFRQSIAPGKWRVNVRTEDGRIIGRVSFTIVATPEPVERVEKLL